MPAADVCQGLERGAAIDGAGRVVRRVDQYGAGVGLDSLLDRRCIGLEAVFRARLDDREGCAGGAEGAGVGGVVGGDDDRVVTRIENALHGGVERSLAARRGDDLVGCRLDAGAPGRGPGHGGAQRRHAGKLSVVMVAFADGPHAGLDGLGWRVEVVVTHREHDDVLAGLLAGHGGEMDLPAILAGWNDPGNTC